MKNRTIVALKIKNTKQGLETIRQDDRKHFLTIKSNLTYSLFIKLVLFYFSMTK